MMKRLITMVGAVLAFAIVNLQAQTTVSGVVTDAELGDPLIGANIIIVGTTVGASTDLDGNFSITSDTPLPWDLEISYTGFAQQNITVTGAQSGMAITMEPSALLGQEVVVSASRRREKVQEAPASISVFNARKLEATPNENPVRALINAPGVSIQQQSAGRINIQLRGEGGLFGSASFPILDYRTLTGPGLGTFDALNSPINNLDIDRIEVVRGAGSALYGPGVTSGVIHFITKSAIDKPGTSIELIGGELNTVGGSFRHATKVSDKFGFKINGVFKRGDEFTLDINDPDDATQIAKLNSTITRPAVANGVVDATQPGRVLWTEEDTDPDGDGNPLQDFWNQQSLTANLEFRPQDDLTVNVAGGWNQASAVFYNSQGEGLSQSRELWAQVRMQKGGLFAQAFILDNNGTSAEKPNFLYQTGNESGVARKQLEGQVQYNFDTPGFLNANWTTGLDYRTSIADSKNQVYGRNEDDDDFSIVGAYLQGKFALGDKFDLVLAGRGDRFNFLDETAFSPRAVLVWKPSPKHTFRGGFNRAVAAPTQLEVNIDFPISTIVPGAFDAWLVGNKNEQIFSDNPVIQFNGLLPFPDVPVGTPGFPNAFTYGAVNDAVLTELTPGIGLALQGGGADAETAAAIAMAIEAYLRDPANTPGGFSGSFFGYNLFNSSVPLGLVNAPAAQLQVEDTWEFGYKGLIGDKLGVAIDVYNRKIDGEAVFNAISPTYALTNANLGADLGAAVVDEDLRTFIFNTLGGDLNPAAGPTADALLPAIQGAYTAGGDIFQGSVGGLFPIIGTTPTNAVPNNGITHVALGYRTFEAYSYWGSDVGLEYYVNDDLSLFGNYSWISENAFFPEIVGSDGATGFTGLGVPNHKFRLGFNYTPKSGLRGNLSFQHDDSFFANLGQFTGDTGARNLFDGAIGYKFTNGLSIDLTGQNLFNNEYRAFPLFPKIGRRLLAKLTYTFGTGK
ncbi:MAG: TonB-dependent receptor [Bacteroidota bacterium]